MSLTETVVSTDRVSASSGVASSTVGFAPPAGAIVVVMVSWLFGPNTTGVTVSLADSNGVAYAAGPQRQDPSGLGVSCIFTHTYSTAPGSVKVIATCSSTAQADAMITPRILTGQAPSQAGAGSNTANASASANMQVAVTTTIAGSYVYIAAAYNPNTTTPLSGTTTLAEWDDNSIGDYALHGRTTSITGTPGATTVGWTAAGSAEWSIAGLEIIPSSGNITDSDVSTGSDAGAVKIKPTGTSSANADASAASDAAVPRVTAQATGTADASGAAADAGEHIMVGGLTITDSDASGTTVDAGERISGSANHITDSDAAHGTESISKVVAGTFFPNPYAPTPEAITPPAPSGSRTHGPRLQIRAPQRTFSKVMHTNGH